MRQTKSLPPSLASALTMGLCKRFSIQFLYQNFPALQEIDLQDVNGLPLGEVVVCKKKLDTVLKFSFLVTL